METAYLVHGSSVRLRLRVPARRYDRGWFVKVKARLLSQPDVLDVRTNPELATLTLHLRTRSMRPAYGSAASVLTAVGVGIARRPPLSDPMPARARKQRATTVRGDVAPAHTRGLRADRRTLALGIFLLLLTRHLLRSGWLAPGLALAWFLWESFPPLRRVIKQPRQGNAD
jgi:hypothetical protein